MDTLKRFPENPILLPQAKNTWEGAGAFNPSVATDGTQFHLVYRAFSEPIDYRGVQMQISSVGYASGSDPMHFGERQQIVTPTEEWDAWGCEDPRITFFEGRYYIFYTALSTHPFSADGIRVGLAITTDFRTFEKHPVTNFNSKAMMLFPERINGKIAAIVTANTDKPPAKIALALFERVEDIWSMEFWDAWYASLDDHVVPLLRLRNDQVEAGAPPVKTADGWLFVYSYITNYRQGWNRVLSIEAALLDAQDPQRVLGRTKGPLLVPEKAYERNGVAANVVFPTGAVLTPNQKLLVYYGAADTSSAVAGMELETLLASLRPIPSPEPTKGCEQHDLVRFSGNPILEPRAELSWEAKAAFNPAAIFLNGAVHLVYRAMSDDNTSVIGYAVSRDGFHIDERPHSPIYVPREPFETKRVPNGNSGCEDPRLTLIGDTLYMFYTAYNSAEPPRVAFTSIPVQDFLARRWDRWDTAAAISPPNFDDKDACLLPVQVDGQYIIFHRIGKHICIAAARDFTFADKDNWLSGMALFGPREDKWDNLKTGIAAPPIETPEGWLLLYHGISTPGNIYKLGAALLARDNLANVIARSEYPLLAPEMKYEREGQVPNVVFPCGAVVRDGMLFVYYGGADRVIGVATADLEELVKTLKRQKP